MRPGRAAGGEHRHACVDCQATWFCYESECPAIAPALCARCLDIRLSGSSAPLRVVMLDRTSPVLGQLFEARKDTLLRRLRRWGQTDPS